MGDHLDPDPRGDGLSWNGETDLSCGGTDNLKITYNAVNTPALEVSDTARADRGTLRSLQLELGF
jgi:hypothetical protein